MTMMMWRATLSLVEVWGFWTVVLVLVAGPESGYGGD